MTVDCTLHALYVNNQSIYYIYNRLKSFSILFLDELEILLFPAENIFRSKNNNTQFQFVKKGQGWNLKKYISFSRKS